jgi:hypothetical protein
MAYSAVVGKGGVFLQSILELQLESKSQKP